MFAVFYKGDFVAFWGNKPRQDWLAGTIKNYGWSENDVLVIWFAQTTNPGAATYFDENKNLVELFPSQAEVNGEMRPVLTPGQVIAGQVYCENGQFKEVTQ